MSDTHLPGTSVFDDEGGFSAFRPHASRLLADLPAFLPWCPVCRILGRADDDLPFDLVERGLLDSCFTPHALKCRETALWSSANPGLSAPHCGLSQVLWINQFSGGVGHSPAPWEA